MTAVPDDRISARMADYYRRQIAWVEDALRALDAMAALPPDSDWEPIVAEDARRAADLKSLEAEYLALKKEWDATPAFLPDERGAVRRLEDRARSLADDFQVKLDAGLARLRDATGAVRGELGMLRKTRDVARKFGAGQPPGGGFVDHRA
jgi:hypothetical protein